MALFLIHSTNLYWIVVYSKIMRGLLSSSPSTSSSSPHAISLQNPKDFKSRYGTHQEVVSFGMSLGSSFPQTIQLISMFSGGGVEQSPAAGSRLRSN
ncbi:hypothetical protein B9Z55_022743 [Caenorhabditis nigoni]|uniref:Uncharacterized protein n=1 Tax=Caenorhabditis nigoni TaxID=1611254 RepID=A0A2G5SLJ4_9PELO|nr:hypothetical protein B9Z55_022743 [Caenorhabditis nigoni]